MSEPCQFPSLNRCQKGFPWANKEINLTRHPVIVFMLQVGKAERFPQTLCLESLNLSLGVSKQGPVLQIKYVKEKIFLC